jgi:hypothetical protein
MRFHLRSWVGRLFRSRPAQRRAQALPAAVLHLEPLADRFLLSTLPFALAPGEALVQAVRSSAAPLEATELTAGPNAPGLLLQDGSTVYRLTALSKATLAIAENTSGTTDPSALPATVRWENSQRVADRFHLTVDIASLGTFRLALDSLSGTPPTSPGTWIAEVRSVMASLNGTTDPTPFREILDRRDLLAWVSQVGRYFADHDPTTHPTEATRPTDGDGTVPSWTEGRRGSFQGNLDSPDPGHSLPPSRKQDPLEQNVMEEGPEVMGPPAENEPNPLASGDWVLPDPWAELEPLASANGALVPAFTVRPGAPAGTEERPAREDVSLNRFLLGLEGSARSVNAPQAPLPPVRTPSEFLAPVDRLFLEKGTAIVGDLPAPGPVADAGAGGESGGSGEGGAE